MSGKNEESLNFLVPELLVGKFQVSNIYGNYTSKGNFSSHGVDLSFSEMGLSKTLKSSEISVLKGKLEDTLRVWENKYQRHLDQKHKKNRAEHVDELNREASEAIHTLKNILNHTLDVDDKVNWDDLKRKDTFRINPKKLFRDGKVPSYVNCDSHGRPIEFKKIEIPAAPVYDQVRNEYSFISKLFWGKEIDKDFKKRIDKWKKTQEEIENSNKERDEFFDQVVAYFEVKKREFEEEQRRDTVVIDSLKDRYSEKDQKAIEEYCDLVLSRSQYPEYFPQNWSLEYNNDSKILILEYDLPSPDQMPTVESYRYVKARDEVTEKLISQAVQKKMYDSVIYQICIRTVHELFEADVVDGLQAVAFNGIVTSTNPATGKKERKVIASVLANKDEFMELDLSLVEPKATFKHLKGIAATTFVDLTPIPPIIKLEKSDKRFIEGRDVVAIIDESINLAAMNWDDFEHLIREIFEKEFAVNGGEVKVTQASSDGGVDAIAFDPDPIRGGKIVIQAKRYTNVVGVAAVRDLYGTVMNEGATKGILVTTSNYGNDSYKFAQDKPITLLNGGNLLSLLEKHGHKARINIAEAKKILSV